MLYASTHLAAPRVRKNDGGALRTRDTRASAHLERLPDESIGPEAPSPCSLRLTWHSPSHRKGRSSTKGGQRPLNPIVAGPRLRQIGPFSADWSFLSGRAH